MARRLVVAGQDKCMHDTSYLINRKPCISQLKINKTQKLSDLINTALTEVQCKDKKSNVVTFLEVKLESVFVFVSKGCFIIKDTKNFLAPPPSYKLGASLSLKRIHNVSLYDFPIARTLLTK